MKLYGEELKKIIEREIEQIHEIQKDRDRRIADGWTDEDDCFMSIRTNSQSLERCRMQLKILEGDGLDDFKVIVDEDGNEVYVHEFRNKWGGYSWVGRGIFASSLKALLKKTGWVEKTIKAPVWVKFYGGSGGGMLGVFTGSYGYCRWHTNMVTGEYVGF